MKYLFVFLALIAGCIGCQSIRATIPDVDVRTHIADSTALLIRYEPDGSPAALCSAVFVSQVELLTAGHCLDLAQPEGEDLDRRQLIGRPVPYMLRTDLVGKTLEDAKPSGMAIVVGVDPYNDLGMLSVGRRTGHDFAMLGEPPPQGTLVYTMGHTVGLPYSMSLGLIGADRVMKRNDDGPFHLFQVPCAASFGDSGGGLWSMDGKLLGIASFVRVDTSLMFYTHHDEIAKFLETEGIDLL